MTMQPSINNEKRKQAVLLHPLIAGMERGAALSLIEEGNLTEALKGETFLRSGEKRTGIYLVIEGKAEVYVERESGRQEVLELIDTGEVVGLSSIHQLLSEREELSTVDVKAAETSQLFFIEFKELKPYLSQLTDYLLKITARRLRDVYHSLSHQLKIGERFPSTIIVFERVGDLIQRPAVTISADKCVSEAAKRMNEERVGALVVVDGEKLAGLITERDMVWRVLAETAGVDTKVSSVMNPLPLAINSEEYYYEGLAKLLSGNSKYMAVLDHGKAAGVITLQDFMRRSNEGALLSFSEVDDPSYPLENSSELSKRLSTFLWRSGTPVAHSLELMTSLHDRIYKRVLKQVETEMNDEPAGGYCFYLMGSAGRREQYFLSDQDHFLLYEKREDRDYYSVFAQRIADLLEKAGFKKCDGNMMASDSQWGGDLGQWEERLRNWAVHANEDTLLKAHNFFSYRLLKGDPALHNSFERMIEGQIQKGRIFLYRLSQSISQVPDLQSSIRSFLGMSRKTICLKKEVLFPFHHSLQVLYLIHGGRSGTVSAKLDFLKERQAISEDFHEELLQAAEYVFKLKIDYRLTHPDDQGDMSLHALSTIQKEKLYYGVKKIKEFQKMMQSYFSV
ncbi:CBS domain-containing protein [Rossellomorea vietnamensis]|uniref:CBS domain-containing protein n=2 Tax=Bacillaceae TaxID=186817 RepID=A0A5D4M8N5_9BACI|nr:CBS domain-containing protein [Rossellomorea vietnamensis]